MSRRNVNRDEWQTVDYYEVLGVEPTATSAEIKRSYAHWVKTLHPDKHSTAPGSQKKAEELTKALNNAYAVLKDKRLRREYDSVRRGEHSHSGNQQQGEHQKNEDTRRSPKANAQVRFIRSLLAFFIAFLLMVALTDVL